MDRTLRAVAHARSAFADLWIDAEEDRVVRAVLVEDAARGEPLSSQRPFLKVPEVSTQLQATFTHWRGSPLNRAMFPPPSITP